MAALVQQVTAPSTGNTTALVVAWPSQPTAGDLLLLAVAADATVTVPDGWILGRSSVDSAGLYLFWRIAAVAESTSVTLVPSGSAGMAAVAQEWAGIVQGAPVDVTASAAPGGTGQTSVTVGPTTATAQADELAVAVAVWWSAPSSAAVTWSDGYATAPVRAVSTGATHNVGVFVATQELAAAGTQQATATYNGGVSHPGAVLVTFKASTDIGPNNHGTSQISDALNGIATYLGGAYDPNTRTYRGNTPTGIGVVRRAWAKRDDHADYYVGMLAGTATGCQVVVHIPDHTERRVAVAGAVQGLKQVEYTVELHCFVRSTHGYAEDAQDDMYAIRDAILARLRADRTLGGAVFQAGEGADDVSGASYRTHFDPPQTSSGGLTKGYLMIEFTAVEYIDA